MTILLALALLLQLTGPAIAPAPELRVGLATYYDAGVMERVWQYRQTHLAPCPECVGRAALLDCADLGRRVWVNNGSEWAGPLHVIDCAQAGHRAMLIARGWVVDLEYELAVRWGMRGPLPVRVVVN